MEQTFYCSTCKEYTEHELYDRGEVVEIWDCTGCDSTHYVYI